MITDLLFIYQQEHYDIKRFLKFCYSRASWWGLQKRQSLDYTKKILLLMVLYIALTLFLIHALVLMSASFMGIAIAILAWYLLTPIIIVISSWIIYPLERILKNKIQNQARQYLAQHRPVVIGITGSYGKTTMKHILTQLLEGAGKHVMVTPGNVNTTLGVAQYIIDNHDKLPHTDYIILEIGAYKMGNIKETAQLVNPDYSFLTAVAPVHLDRFGSIENIMKAKVELAQETKDTAYVNGEVAKAVEAIRQAQHVNKYETITLNHGDNIKPLDNFAGITFEMNGESYTTKMLAEYNMIYIIMATKFLQDSNIETKMLKQAVAAIEPFSHRLVPTHNASTDVWVIDDSYNGNEAGFESGLRVLSRAKKRKLVMTPGLVELGNASKETHERIADLYMKQVDHVLLIDSRGSRYMKQYFDDHAFENYTYYSDAETAHKSLGTVLQRGDTILFSNDLTDNYN